MNFFFVLIIFSLAFFLLSIGIIFKKKGLHAGSCGSHVEVKGEVLTCGACPSKEAELCASGDKDGFATVAQLGNPARKKIFVDKYFSKN